MNSPAVLHPDADCLSLFGTGQLSADEAAGIEAHVSDCPECCEALRGVADDPFAALVRRATSATPAPRSGDTTPQFASRLLGEFSADSTSPNAPAAAPAIVEVPAELREHARYRVLELLGYGGMGAVYKAEHRLMQRTVALKLITRDLTSRPGVAERFIRETRTAGRLAHPNIAQAFDAEQAGDTLFLVMEFVPGTDLARLVRERGPLPCAEACRHIQQAALALQHAHERGMVHRDIKPHNLMLTPDGEIKVLDFGLARFDLAQPKADTSQLTEEGLFMGTADYVAPEQARDAHHADIRADIYSLGCTLYQLLTGQVPFPAKTVMDKVIKHATEQPAALSTLRPDLPAGLEDVVMKMMAKLPDQRYQTPGEVAEALAPFATAAVTTMPLLQPGRLGRTGIRIESELVRDPVGAFSQTAVLPAGGRQSDRGRWWRQPVAVAAGLLFVAAALAGLVVYRIQTDTGEVVIETTDKAIEVVVTRGGEFVTIYDPKSGQKLILRSGTYELELKGKPTGLKLVLDGGSASPQKVTLKRGDVVIAKIERVPPATATKVQEFKWPGDVIFEGFSPNGDLALISIGKELELWDVATRKKLRRFEGQYSRCPTYFSPDGKKVASASYWPDSQVRIWDVESGRLVRSFWHGVIREGFGRFGYPTAVAFSPDGKTVFSSGVDVRQWDWEEGKEVKRFQVTRGFPYSVAVSRDGRYVVSGSTEGSHGQFPHPHGGIFVWEVESGKMVRWFEGHTTKGKEGESQVLFLPDGSGVLSRGPDQTVRLWNIGTGKEVRRFEERTHLFTSIGVGPDGRYLRSSGEDRTVRLWDLETGKELQRFTDPSPGVMGCYVSPDGRFATFSVIDKIVHLWRLPDPPAARDKP